MKELMDWHSYYKILNEETKKAQKKAEEKARATSSRRR